MILLFLLAVYEFNAQKRDKARMKETSNGFYASNYFLHQRNMYYEIIVGFLCMVMLTIIKLSLKFSKEYGILFEQEQAKRNIQESNHEE